MAFAGAHPFWQWRPLTLSEAAAVRDAGEIGRLLELGNDPNARYPLRAGILYDEPSLLTPVQAARAAQRDEIVDLLVSAGARLEDDRADSNPADTR
jgi:hypothetical protein